MPKRIALFASGSGSNVENIIHYFSNNSSVKVELIVCNNPHAFVLERAKKLNVVSHLISKSSFKETEDLLSVLKQHNVDFIVLAGFLWLIPSYLINAYPNKIINIHPALLPKYGGKGMYGDKVHDAVIANKEKESGITIHYVSEEYDEGKIIFQAKCKIDEKDTPETLVNKIHALEFEHFPKVIEKLLNSL